MRVGQNTAEMMRIFDYDEELFPMVQQKDAAYIESLAKQLAAAGCYAFDEVDFSSVDWGAVADRVCREVW